MGELYRRFKAGGATSLPGTGLMNFVNAWMKIRERDDAKTAQAQQTAPDLFEQLPLMPPSRQRTLLREEHGRLAERLARIDALLDNIE